MDFRKNVLSDNRQSWINELRELISELISLINLHLIDPNNINSEDAKRINFLIVKSEFMLNPIKDIEYINSIRDLKNLIFDLSREKITYESSREKIEILKENTKKTLKLNEKELKMENNYCQHRIKLIASSSLLSKVLADFLSLIFLLTLALE